MVINYLDIEKQRIDEQVRELIRSHSLDEESKVLSNLWNRVFEESGRNENIALSRFSIYVTAIDEYLLEVEIT